MTQFVPQSQRELEECYIRYYPRGSGPLGMMCTICELLVEVATLRGYTTDFEQLRKDNGIKS